MVGSNVSGFHNPRPYSQTHPLLFLFCQQRFWLLGLLCGFLKVYLFRWVDGCCNPLSFPQVSLVVTCTGSNAGPPGKGAPTYHDMVSRVVRPERIQHVLFAPSFWRAPTQYAFKLSNLPSNSSKPPDSIPPPSHSIPHPIPHLTISLRSGSSIMGDGLGYINSKVSCTFSGRIMNKIGVYGLAQIPTTSFEYYGLPPLDGSILTRPEDFRGFRNCKI
jgi:hypothetical protein